MAKTTYGKTFRTRRGKVGSYKYVNGRKVAFVLKNKGNSKSRRPKKSSYWYRGPR